jgi:hypothetical protein
VMCVPKCKLVKLPHTGALTCQDCVPERQHIYQKRVKVNISHVIGVAFPNMEDFDLSSVN